MFIRKNHPQVLLLVLIVVFMSGSVNGLAENKPLAPESIDGVLVVTAEEAADLILSDPDMPIIDSRKKAVHAKGYIEGAVNIVNIEMTRDILLQAAPDKEHAILFYCNGVHCLRSADAIEKAKSWGYTKPVWLRGGWQEWTEKHLPVWVD